ncbi:MAG: tRNA (guanosine(37)-N1)-methyltransferase TrmD [Sciscionella sp.]
MSIDVLSIFPEYLAPLRAALLGRAIDRGLIELAVHDLRDWATDVHRSVDDSPYGGGPGMVMRPDVWGSALNSVAPPSAAVATESQVSAQPTPTLVIPTPAGRPFTQRHAERFASSSRLVFACGRYEGIDQRFIDQAAQRMPVEELSIGDYVLIGGEVAVLAIVEAVVRLLPGVLGNPLSAQQDSFSDGLLEGPSYTRPEVWCDRAVPEVLRSGNHAAIAAWRRAESLRRTWRRRPDLIEALSAQDLDAADRAVLNELRHVADRATGATDASEPEPG